MVHDWGKGVGERVTGGEAPGSNPSPDPAKVWKSVAGLEDESETERSVNYNNKNIKS